MTHQSIERATNPVSRKTEDEVRRASGWEPKANYRNGQRVTIHSLGDGKEHRGTVCGKASINIWDTYIVRLDDPGCFPGNEWECITVWETCLRAGA